MARYKDYNQSQGEFIAVQFKEQLFPGTFEYTLNSKMKHIEGFLDTQNPKQGTRDVEKIERPEIRDLYSRRMAIIEPVFANITYHKKLNKFTLRTKVNVNI